MNLGVIYNLRSNKPICVIVHDYTNENIGYSTYDNNLSMCLDIILNNNIYSKNKLNNKIQYITTNINNPYFLFVLNDFLPNNYKITWIKEINDNIDKILNEAYNLLDMEDNNEKIN